MRGETTKPTGMTLKQFARAEFFAALQEYVEARQEVAENPSRFIIASVRIHAAKSGVPKRLWRLVNQRTKAGS